MIPSLHAPLNRGNYLGKVELYIQDELLYTSNVYLDKQIKKNGVLDYMKRGIKEIFEIDVEF